MMDALLIQMNDGPTYPATGPTIRGSGSYTTEGQHQEIVRVWRECGGSDRSERRDEFVSTLQVQCELCMIS